MDKFNRIINEGGLYDFRVIKEMGEKHRNWHKMSWRERELLLLHIHLCILMCNKELVSRKRKKRREDKIDTSRPGPSKIGRMDVIDTEMAPHDEGASADNPSTSGTISSYESDWSREEHLLIELTSMEADKDYRFSLLNYMPLVETTINHVAKEWNIGTPIKVWDIADKKTKKFIMIRYVDSKTRAMNRYYQAKSEVPDNCGMYLIKWVETAGVWIDMADMVAHGEEKVKRFLLKRKIVMETMGIHNECFKLKEGEMQDLFPSPWLNECLDKWSEDLLSDQFEKWALSDLYVKEHHLNPDGERSHKMFYKGKIMPEHLVQNIQVEEREDSSCVDRVISCIRDQLNNIIGIREENMHKNLSCDILPDLVSAWENSNKSTFNFINNINCPGHKKIEAALGIGEKKKTYAEYTSDMKQPDSKGIEKCIYPEWYEEVAGWKRNMTCI